MYLNLSLADEHVGDVTIPTQVIEYNQNFLRRISQSDWNIQIKLNYIDFVTTNGNLTFFSRQHCTAVHNSFTVISWNKADLWNKR